MNNMEVSWYKGKSGKGVKHSEPGSELLGKGGRMTCMGISIAIDVFSGPFWLQDSVTPV